MRGILNPIVAAFTVQAVACLMAQPTAPDAPATVDPDAQYVLGPDSQPQAEVPEGKEESC